MYGSYPYKSDLLSKKCMTALFYLRIWIISLCIMECRIIEITVKECNRFSFVNCFLVERKSEQESVLSHDVE